MGCTLWIFYRDSSFYPLVKTQLASFSDFLGSVGGLLGLFAGVSMISIIEFLYFFIYKPILRTVLHRVHKIHPRNLIKIESQTVPQINEQHVLYQLSAYFLEFLNRSTIHGVNFIADTEQNFYERIFWIIFVAFSITICYIMTIATYKHAELNPAVINIDERLWTIKDVCFLLKLSRCIQQSNIFADSISSRRFLSRSRYRPYEGLWIVCCS